MKQASNALIADVLESAAIVICVPGWHTKHWFAKTPTKRLVDVYSKDAICFCAVGAIKAAALCCVPDWTTNLANLAADLAILEVSRLLKREENVKVVSEYNDDPATTAPMVAEKLWRTAQNLRKQNADN